MNDISREAALSLPEKDLDEAFFQEEIVGEYEVILSDYPNRGLDEGDTFTVSAECQAKSLGSPL